MLFKSGQKSNRPTAPVRRPGTSDWERFSTMAGRNGAVSPAANVEVVRPETGFRAFITSLLLVIPLVLCNAVAIYGQTQWALDNLTKELVIAVAFAGALESVGAYLAFEAHSALLSGASSGKLRGASYGVGVLVGVLNASHWAENGHLTSASYAFGALSALSPWLWSVRSRRLNRELLRSKGLVEERAVKFSTARWVLFPARTMAVFRSAVWFGIVDPIDAVTAFDPERPTDPDRLPVPEVTVSQLSDGPREHGEGWDGPRSTAPALPAMVPALSMTDDSEPVSKADSEPVSEAGTPSATDVTNREVVAAALSVTPSTAAAYRKVKVDGHNISRSTVYAIAGELADEKKRRNLRSINSVS